MNLILRARIIASCAVVLALWLAWQLATGDYGLPALIGAAALGLVVVAMFRAPVEAVILATLLFGYLVGNRGFAQLMPNPALPLLPAEIGLALAGGWLAWQSAWHRTLPFRRDLLNLAVLLWLLVGTVRVIFDARAYGMMALRDYAMIYYAAFFFIAQQCTLENSRRFLMRALVAASIVQPVAALLVEAFPNFFLSNLTIRGVPIIYFKGDLALTFTAVSALVLYCGIKGGHRYWAWPLATFELLYVITGANRASMLGALVALGWLAISPARRFVVLQAAAIAAAFLLVSGFAFLTENEWAHRKFEGAVERVRSIADITGRGTYVTEESGMKGDNNRFRSLWWRVVIDETMEQNPVFGLGFGYDLARSFLQEYNPEIEDFTARSPHSIVVTVFGRMGFVGLIVFVSFCAVLAARTWRAMRDSTSDPQLLGLWTASWVILISACLGVVLEGPMGAVVFWSLLGIANSYSVAPTSPEPTAEAAVEDPDQHEKNPAMAHRETSASA